MKPLISIVTVSRNAEKTIEKTLISVLEQTYTDMEYIIVDGNSSDKTMETVNGYEKIFREKKISFYFISEKDDGVYFAMNKAIEYCTGEWILFLNANDRLFDKNTIGNVVGQLKDEKVDCVYGSTWNEKNGLLYHKKAYPINVIYYKAPFIHQALFIRYTVMKKYRFDTRYTVSADYDLFVRMFIDGVMFKRIYTDISIFNLDGISQNSKDLVAAEWNLIQTANGINNKYYLHKKIRQFVIKLKQNKYLYLIYIYCKKLMYRKEKNI